MKRRTPSATSRTPQATGRRPPAALKKALAALKGKDCLITFHSLADCDATGSALALAAHLGPRALVAPADHINSESKRLMGPDMSRAMAALGASKRHASPFARARALRPRAPVILLDANDRSILPQLEGVERVDILIDHHAPNPGSVRGEAEWIEPDASSACELVAALIGPPDADQARWLVWGLLSDSARLRRADGATFAALAALLPHADEDYEHLLRALDQPAAAEGRAQVLEGLRQSAWFREGEWVVATAQVGSRESHVADALVAAGADAAFVGSSDRKGARISARLRPALGDAVDLPALMEEVGRGLGGEGGGHPCAAGAAGPRGDRLAEALAAAQRELLARLRGG